MDDGPIQGIFDFESGNADRFENWRRQQEARLEAIRQEWRIPVGRRVRIRLRSIDGDFEGKLELAQPPGRIDGRVPLHLRIDRVDVYNSDIEQCIVLD